MASIKKHVKINHDYFSLTPRWENMKYFLRQGHLLSHIIDRVKWQCFPRYFITPDFPTHIDIEASSACQMRCPMCKTTEMTNNGINFAGFMEYGLFKKITDECAASSAYSIKLSWRGEPLLNPKIIEMVSYAKEKGIKDVAFLTNAERLSKELSEGLVGAGLDWISVSFDGMGDVYNSIRKPAVFEETVNKIVYLRKYRDSFGLMRPLIRVQSVHSAIRG
nr:radical SAM protein [Candidatus Omnitrophota bacterium]